MIRTLSEFTFIAVLAVTSTYAHEGIVAPGRVTTQYPPALKSLVPLTQTPPATPAGIIEQEEKSASQLDSQFQSDDSAESNDMILPDGWASPNEVWVAPSDAWQPTDEVPQAPAECLRESELFYRGSRLIPGTTLEQKSIETGAPYYFTPYRDSRNAYYRLSDDCLPGATDPNDFQSSSLLGTESLGLAVPIVPVFFGAPPEWAASPEGVKARLGLQVRPGVFYDTGFINSTVFFPPKIALDGSNDAHNRGQITFVDFDKLSQIPGRGQVDLQTLEFSNVGPAQVYADVFTPDGSNFVARNLYARIFDSSRTSAFLVGKGATVFGDDASIPVLIQSGALPIGAISAKGNTAMEEIFTGIPQLRYSRFLNGNVYELTGSIEDQSGLSDLDTPPAGSKFLNRYPVIAGRYRYNPTRYNSIQIATLIRPIVLDDPSFNDHTEVGWGTSAIAKWYNVQQTDGLLIGAVTGEGIGGYVYGGSFGAIAPTATSISLLNESAAYAGYQHVWYKADANHNLSSTFAYGFVNADAPRASDNRLLHQAWANLLWNFTANTATGIEYQFGEREVGDGRSGDDHRIMFVLQLQPSTKPNSAPSSYELRDSSTPRLSDYRL